MRRDEHPVKRTYENGRVRWVARYTGSDGRRHIAGTYAKAGPCKQPRPDGECCAQHRIWRMYEADTPRRGPVETVGEYFAVWLDRHPRSRRTDETHAGRLRAVLDVDLERRAFRDLRMRDVRGHHVGDLIDVLLRDQGRAVEGARRVLSTCSAMWRDAIRDGITDANPFRDAPIRSNDPRARKQSRIVTVVSWEQMHEFARHAGPHEAMVRVLSDCGLRLGELLALERRHIQGDDLVVEQTAWNGRITPGTKQSAGRVVPIPPGLRTLLDALPPRIDTRALFPSPSGGVWHHRNFYRAIWHPTQRSSGLMLRPHEMRHSYVSLMRAAGVDPADLADATGHTVQTATSRYTHGTGRSAEAMRRAVG